MENKLFSPVLSAANNIVKSKRPLSRTAKDYNNFVSWLDTSNKEIKKIKLPTKKKVESLASNLTFNIASSGGGGGIDLIGSLLGGAGALGGGLGLRGLLRGKGGNKLSGKKINEIEEVPKEKIGKIKGLPEEKPRGKFGKIGGILNVGLAVWDYAGRKGEGQSNLQAGVGAAGGALGGMAGAEAGATAGAAIGSLFGGVGAVPGAIIGGLIGGFAGGSLGSGLADKLTGADKMDERLKDQEKKQREAASRRVTFPDVINKFDKVVGKFEKFAGGMGSAISGKKPGQTGQEDVGKNYDPSNADPIDTQTQNDPTGKDLPEVDATGGEVPGKPDSPFNQRRGNHIHKGNDYFRPSGTPISVIQSGTVTVADMNYDPGGWGSLIEIRHEDGSLSRYAHMRRHLVTAGQKINPGQVIGETGGGSNDPGKGNAQGPHLHFEYLPPGSKSQVDPTEAAKNLFRFGGNVKVKPSGQQPGQTSSGENPFILELHADPGAKGQKSGLIASYLAGESPVSRSLSSSFGSYGKGFRQGDLAVPKRGGNILESDISKGVEANARTIVAAMMKDPKRVYEFFAGHADVTKGETGGKGEREYNMKLAEAVEAMAKKAGLNVRYFRSIIANEDSDPNNNMNRIAALYQKGQQRQGQPTSSQQISTPVLPSPRASSTPRSVPQQLMGGASAAAPNTTIIMQQPAPAPAAPAGQARMIPVPVGGGGGGGASGSVITEGQIVNSLLKAFLLTNLSGT